MNVVIISAAVSFGVCFLGIGSQIIWNQQKVNKDNQKDFVPRNEHTLCKEHMHHELNELKTDTRKILDIVLEIKDKM